MNLFCKTKGLIGRVYCAMFCALLLLPMQVLANIPTTDDFAAGANDRDAVGVLFWLMGRFLQVIVFGLAAYGIVIVIKNAIAKYNEIGDGRATYMDVGIIIIAGLAILTLAIIMLNWLQSWIS